MMQNQDAVGELLHLSTAPDEKNKNTSDLPR